MDRPNIAVIGCGYWGKNVVRTFHKTGALRCVCDVRSQVLDTVREQYGVQTSSSIAEVLADPEVDGVAIAAPAVHHYQLVRQALEAGKHVLVEKPLALRLTEGRHLAEIADSRSRVLMVGHILQYHPAILKLKELISAGELGRIKYIYSSRLNLGKLRAEENILWSFAPHDISAVLYLLEEMPTRVSSLGGTYVDSRVADTTLSTCQFASGANVHIFVSWLHPFKEQKLTIVGGKKMAVFDDVEPERKLVLYSHRIDWVDRMPVAHREDGQLVPISKDEPLQRECEHFLECIRDIANHAQTLPAPCRYWRCWMPVNGHCAVGAVLSNSMALGLHIPHTPARSLTLGARSGATQKSGTSRTLWREQKSAHAAISGRTWSSLPGSKSETT